MTLVETYEKYNKINKDYINFIDELLKKNFLGYDQNFVKERLSDFQNAFESVKLESDKVDVLKEDEDNLRDLKYLIVDSLFLALDLAHFYNCKETERFKMRAVNYLNKKRRADMFL